MNFVQRPNSRQSFARWEFSNTGRLEDIHLNASRSAMMTMSAGGPEADASAYLMRRCHPVLYDRGLNNPK